MFRTPYGGVFWRSADGRTEIIRYTDRVFELRHNGILVMPIGPFRALCDYVWAEFPPW